MYDILNNEIKQFIKRYPNYLNQLINHLQTINIYALIYFIFYMVSCFQTNYITVMNIERIVYFT